MKKKHIVNFVLALLLVLAFGTNVSAGSKTLNLPKNQAWVSVSATRTGNYTYCFARCLSVYSSTSSDNFTRIQVRVVNSKGTCMSTSSALTLSETASSSSTIHLKNGLLGEKNIRFQFRGNEPKYAATAKVTYDAK